MINFSYAQASSVNAAIDAVTKDASATFIAGGTNLVDLMKRGVQSPTKLVDITRLPLKNIEKRGANLFIGALVSNRTVADDPGIKENYPLLAMAINAGASPQIRNMATIGGNMLQRTRCHYFYDTAMPCNKREPGSGCGALNGYNRMHAIIGASEKCIAVHPSDMCIALAALNATVLVQGPKGNRAIPFANFLRLPGDTPQFDNTLQKGELVLGVELPPISFGKKVHYLKIRDRASFAFALLSVAAAIQLNGNTISDVRIAMGGIAHKPWRMMAAESFLKGKTASPSNFRQAAALSLEGAQGFGYNNFKLRLAPEAVADALLIAANA